MGNAKIKRVLMSVTDKTGLAEFASALSSEFGVEIVSTGGTARALQEKGITVIPIEAITDFPEMMDGRVKTLHPRVHGGLLARRDDDSHMAQAVDHGIGMIDMVVVNLYAFTKTVESGADFDTCIENIDIGGPSMLRSAAKNHESVTVVTDPASYNTILEEMRANGGATTLATRRALALKVYQTTSSYDGAISAWLAAALNDEASSAPDKLTVGLTKVQDLRYGENPHQKASFYRRDDYKLAKFSLGCAQQMQGKELSYNNYLDLDAAWTAVREFEKPACVIIKHLTPCGVCVADNVVEAYKLAHECDRVSAFGGVMAFNRPVELALIEAIFENKQFVEAIIAPEYSDDALAKYQEKAGTRLLRTGGINAPGGEVEYRSVEGGVLCMDSDTATEDPANFTVATKRQPTVEEMEQLVFAWKACKSVKSNAILLAKDFVSVGVGGGQPNRVNSAKIAVDQAGENAQGAVAASDAFFPFRDGFDVLAKAGVTAVIQPGGSMRDDEIIAAADEQGLAMVFTGHRHFRH